MNKKTTRRLVVAAALVSAATGPAWAESMTELQCGSVPDGGPTFCPLPADVNRVYIAREQSHMPCVFNKSWGLSGTQLWTADGCAATFRVHFEPFGGEVSQPEPTEQAPALDNDDLPFGYVDGKFRREA